MVYFQSYYIFSGTTYRDFTIQFKLAQGEFLFFFCQKIIKKSFGNGYFKCFKQLRVGGITKKVYMGSYKVRNFFLGRRKFRRQKFRRQKFRRKKFRRISKSRIFVVRKFVIRNFVVLIRIQRSPEDIILIKQLLNY